MFGLIIHNFRCQWIISISQTRLLPLLVSFCIYLHNSLFPSCGRSHLLRFSALWSLFTSLVIWKYHTTLIFSWLVLPLFQGTTSGSRTLRLCVLYNILLLWTSTTLYMNVSEGTSTTVFASVLVWFHLTTVAWIISPPVLMYLLKQKSQRMSI